MTNLLTIGYHASMAHTPTTLTAEERCKSTQLQFSERGEICSAKQEHV